MLYNIECILYIYIFFLCLQLWKTNFMFTCHVNPSSSSSQTSPLFFNKPWNHHHRKEKSLPEIQFFIEPKLTTFTLIYTQYSALLPTCLCAYIYRGPPWIQLLYRLVEFYFLVFILGTETGTRKLTDGCKNCWELGGRNVWEDDEYIGYRRGWVYRESYCASAASEWL